MDPEWKIENVVATVALDVEGDGKKIDLNRVARRYPNTEYNPERFPGLVMRVEEPKCTFLVFSTANMVVTGLRQEGDAEIAAGRVADLLKKAGIPIVSEPRITIQNIVASGDLNVAIDMNEAVLLLENAMYEPEVFPGLIYRMQEPKAVFLIFSTGRIVCTGAKTREAVRIAIEHLARKVEDLGIYFKDLDDEMDEDDFF